MPPHGMGPTGAMPPGHPPMGMGRMRPTSQPSTRPFTGTLTVQAIQGTRDGPSPAGDEVAIELFTHAGVRNINVKLDGQAKAVLNDLDLQGPSQARVVVRHAGVPYPGISGLLHADQPAQTVEVVVYETSSTPPPWQVLMRHVMLQPTDQALQAMEVFVIHNPTDRAYIVRDDAGGPGTSITLPVPPNAEQVGADGMFDECCVKVEPGKLTSTQALLPGNTRVRMGYVVPAREGKARLELTAPAPVATLSVFLPEGAAVVESQGLQASEPFQRGDTRMQMYRGGNMEAGQTVSLVVSAAPGGSADGAGAGDGPVAGHEALIIVVVVALVLVLAAGTAAWKRKRRAAAADDQGGAKDDEVKW